MNQIDRSDEASAGPLRAFWREYRRPVFWHYDAISAYATAVGSWALLTVSPAARDSLDRLTGSGVTVSALGLTFVLASFSLLSAMLNAEVVAALDGLEQKQGSRRYGLDGIVVAFRSTSAFAAASLLSWIATQAVITDSLSGNGWQAAEVIFGGLGIGFTVWLALGITALIGIIATLVRGKAQLTRYARLEDKNSSRSA